MTHQKYLLVHLAGIMLLYFGFGGVLLGGLGKTKTRFVSFISHGAGLLLLIVSGFGLLAHLQLTQGLPGWAYAKVAVWTALGIGISIARRKADWTFSVSVLLIAIGVIGAYLGHVKPQF